MTTALEGGEWSAARPDRTLPPGKTRYPLYRRLSGSQGPVWTSAEKLAPTDFRSLDCPSPYRLRYPGGIYMFVCVGTAIAQWLRCCATNRKVAGSIPDGVFGIFHIYIYIYIYIYMPSFIASFKPDIFRLHSGSFKFPNVPKLRFPRVSVPSDKRQCTTLRWRTNACFFPDFFIHVN